MAKPWATQKTRPDNETLRRLTAEKSHREIGEMYNVTRQAVGAWVKKLDETHDGPARLAHKRLIPWELKKSDSYDQVARALVALSRIAQGAEVSPAQRRQAATLTDHLDRTNRVVSYTREDGFKLVPRDNHLDDPDLPIRRP